MKILSIETSCDETALAILNATGDKNNPKFEIISSAINSQIDIHKQYGGVFPSLAKREHAKNLIPLFEKVLGRANISHIENPDSEKLAKIAEIFNREPELYKMFADFIPKVARPDFDMIAVTVGPGLEPALWVGINFARALSLYWDIPVMPVNHMEGHIVSILKKGEVGENVTQPQSTIQFPAIALLISGGHTELVLVKNWSYYEIIGRTKDDAVGEAFDKVARILDLPYPGGPEISKLAEIARASNLKSLFDLPRPMIKTNDFDFSFSGLKTAVLYLVKKLKEENSPESLSAELSLETKKMIALEFENAVTEVLLTKTKKALNKYSAKQLIIGGGVIANKNIRKTFSELSKESAPDTEKFAQISIIFPEINLATDNAIMIGIAGYLKTFHEKPTINPQLKALGNLTF